MADFDAGSVLGQIAEALTKFSDSVKVIGDPVEAAGKIVIPAVVARVGFGAGGGFGHPRAGEEGPGTGGGAGGGGGLTMTPVFLIVDAAGERILTVPDGVSAVSGIVEKVKEVVTQVCASGKSGGAEKKET
jgi:uncharacterized spore protein YtfJ